MAYVEPSTAANRSVDTIGHIKDRNGPGTWRVPVAASPRNRVLLYHWLPGTASDAHIHPECDELFVIHDGQATFELGSGDLVQGASGSIIYVPAGQRHSVRATGERPLVMMIVVSPNVPNDATTEGA